MGRKSEIDDGTQMRQRTEAMEEKKDEKCHMSSYPLERVAHERGVKNLRHYRLTASTAILEPRTIVFCCRLLRVLVIFSHTQRSLSTFNVVKNFLSSREKHV